MALAPATRSWQARHNCTPRFKDRILSRLGNATVIRKHLSVRTFHTYPACSLLGRHARTSFRAAPVMMRSGIRQRSAPSRSQVRKSHHFGPSLGLRHRPEPHHPKCLCEMRVTSRPFLADATGQGLSKRRLVDSPRLGETLSGTGLSASWSHFAAPVHIVAAGFPQPGSLPASTGHLVPGCLPKRSNSTCHGRQGGACLAASRLRPHVYNSQPSVLGQTLTRCPLQDSHCAACIPLTRRSLFLERL
jgi:hypothetical protein